MAAIKSILRLKFIIMSILCYGLCQVTDDPSSHDDPDIMREMQSDPRNFAGWSTNSPYSPIDSNDFYSFTVVDINGNDIPLEKYRGKVTLVVNVASQCGFTDSHYKALVKLQKELESTNRFSVLAFPCNQFGRQEPWSHGDIQRFVKSKYGVNFPLFAKINVIDENVLPAFQYLVDKSGHSPTWNFWKYLLNENGQVIGTWAPQVSVEAISETIRQAVHQASYGTHQEL